MFIYVAENTKTGKKYVGLTKYTVGRRWLGHIKDAARGKTSLLHKAIRKYGAEVFTVSAIDLAENAKQLSYKEQFWIKELNTLAPNGYNLTTGGEFTKMTPALKKTLSQAAVRRFSNPDEKSKQSERTHRYWDVEENRIAQSLTITQTFIDKPELRAGVSDTHKKLWQTESHRVKTIASQRAGWSTEEAKKNASVAAKKRHADGCYAGKQRPVMLSDGRIFSSIAECAIAISANPANVGECARGNRKSVAGFTVRFVEQAGHSNISQLLKAD